MSDTSEPVHISKGLPDAIGDVSDPIRRKEVELRDSVSEVEGLEVERREVAEAAQGGDPGVEAALDGLTKTLLDAQADHFERRKQGSET